MIDKTALVLEGGGFRGVFTAGVLEVFLEKNIFFESVYGVSAGAAYAASYLSKQPGRNLAVNEYIGDKRYCSFRNLMKQGSMFSWEFIYEEIPQVLIPYDYEALKNAESKFYVGTSDCETGETEFFQLNTSDKKVFKTILSASGSLPLIAPMVHHQNKYLLDGGLSDSVPFEYALANGHDWAVVVLTQPAFYKKGPMKMKSVFRWYYRKYPKVYDMLLTRAERYNAAIERLQKLEKEGVVFVIRPEEVLSVKRLENNPQKTAEVYKSAMELTRSQLPDLEKWLRK